MVDISLSATNGADGLTLTRFQRERSGGARFELVVSSRRFHGRTSYALESEELSALISDLEQMYASCSGTADMRLHDEEEHVAFHCNELGHVLVTGVLIDYEHPPQRLEFAFHSDQSCLASFIADLASGGERGSDN